MKNWYYDSKRKEFEEAIAEGKTLVISKYGSNGWGTWKPVELEKAMHKISIKLEDGYCPYKVVAI